MAVAPTGAIYKALEFDGVSSRTYGVYITGEAVYNAPERDVEMIAIPGRNGSFALDKGRFENIEVSYPAGIFADAESDFAEAVSDFRNFLCSRNGYVRLQDEYNPNEYRMAVYKSGLEVTPAQLKAGEFNIVFECKPQRWLTSGESAVTVGEWSDWETESGPIVEIEASETDKVKSLSVALEPIQEGSGTPSPDNVRPISGRTECVTQRTGKNLVKEVVTAYVSPSQSGYAVYTNGTTQKSLVFDCVEGQTYTISGMTIDRFVYGVFDGMPTTGDRTEVFESQANNIPLPRSITPQKSGVCVVYLSASSADTSTAQIEVGSTATTDYEPYNGTTYTTDLGRTVYGGTLDVVSGELVVDRAIVVLDGTQSLNVTVLSDFTQIGWIGYNTIGVKNASFVCDKFASGAGLGTIYSSASAPRMFFGLPTSVTTSDEAKAWFRDNPTTVVYPIATPQTYQLTPTEVALLKGDNNVWSDGDVTLEYGQDPNVIVNPTLFKTSPLIECKGTGNIYLNSDQITINNLPIGDVSLASAKSSSTDSVSSSFNIDNAALLNPGDTITVASGCSTEVSFSWASSVALQSITPTISGTLPGGQVYGSLLSMTSLKCTTIMGAATFAYGTSSYYESTVSVAFEYLQSGTSYTKTCTYEIRCSYDGSNTITFSITNKTGASPFSFTSASACSLKAIKGTSTRLTTTDTIYIDLDIGEAYIINSGTITSINDIVSMPSRLPTLKPGTNTITYANTITNLKIMPRWWKV